VLKKLLSILLTAASISFIGILSPSVADSHSTWGGTTYVYAGPEVTTDIYWDGTWHDDEGGYYQALDMSGNGVGAGTDVALYAMNFDEQVWIDYFAHDGTCAGIDIPFWDNPSPGVWIQLGEIHYLHIAAEHELNVDELLGTEWITRHLGWIASQAWMEEHDEDCLNAELWTDPHLHQSGGHDTDSQTHHVDYNSGVQEPIDPFDEDAWLHKIHG